MDGIPHLPGLQTGLFSLEGKKVELRSVAHVLSLLCNAMGKRCEFETCVRTFADNLGSTQFSKNTIPE